MSEQSVPAGAKAVVPKVRVRKVAQWFRNGRTYPFAPHDAECWFAAASWLVENGELRAGEFGMRALLAEQPEFPRLAGLVELFDHLPRVHRVLPDIRDDAASDVQVVPRPDCDLAVVVFCGLRHRLGMPLPMMHRWLARLGGSVIYLRDFRDLCFMGGVGSLGGDLRSTQAALKRLIAGLGASRIVCYGVSGGGYGAMRYALDLGGDAISLGGPVNMTPRFNAHLNHRLYARQMAAAFPDEELDLRARFEAAPTPTRALVIYGERHWNERIHAEAIRGVPGVELHEIAGGDKHADIAEIVRRGDFEPVFKGFIKRGVRFLAAA